MATVAKQPQPRGFDFRGAPQLDPFLLPNARPTGRRIGSGAYGTVEELDVEGLLCAGKKLHDILILVEWRSGAPNVFAGKLVKECSLLSSLRHPHLVQFLGVCFLETTDLPVLVSEYLPHCLGSLLEDGADMSLAMKCSILSGVGQAMAYLHARTPPVIHSDITARNILLTTGMMAKIADLGVARLVAQQLGGPAVTMKQTLPYMPPEALEENPKYSTATDLFSFGHLALYTITQDFPYPSPPVVVDLDNPGLLVARSEVQRRSQQMEQLTQLLGQDKHPLVQLITQCLHNDPRQRPSARQVLSQLEEVKAEIEDPYQLMSKLELIQTLKRREAGGNWGALEGQLQIKKAELEACQAEIRVKEAEARSKLEHVQEQLKRQKEEDQELLGELKSKEQEIQKLRAQLRRKATETTELAREQTQVSTHQPTWSFKWRRGSNVSDVLGLFNSSIYRGHSAVTLSGKVYIHTGSNYLHVYNPKSDHWNQLTFTSNGYKNTMAVFNQQLVLVGGQSILVWNETSQEWTTPYPNMPTARNSSVVVAHQQFLVVAGGYTHDCFGVINYVRDVKIFNSSTKQWLRPSPLPEKSSQFTSCVFNDTLYLLNGSSGNVFSISLSALVSQATPTPPAPPPSWEVIVGMDSLSYSTMVHMWPPTAPRCWKVTKLSSSTFVCLHDRLLAVGGKDEKGKPVSAIHLYNPKTGQKTKVGDIPAFLFECFCVVLPSGELMVLGGMDEDGQDSTNVFIATVE